MTIRLACTINNCTYNHFPTFLMYVNYWPWCQYLQTVYAFRSAPAYSFRSFSLNCAMWQMSTNCRIMHACYLHFSIKDVSIMCVKETYLVPKWTAKPYWNDIDQGSHPGCPSLAVTGETVFNIACAYEGGFDCKIMLKYNKKRFNIEFMINLCIVFVPLESFLKVLWTPFSPG